MFSREPRHQTSVPTHCAASKYTHRPRIRCAYAAPPTYRAAFVRNFSDSLSIAIEVGPRPSSAARIQWAQP
jgi:hypothetical protein